MQVNETGGILTPEDLASYAANLKEPLSTQFNGIHTNLLAYIPPDIMLHCLGQNFCRGDIFVGLPIFFRLSTPSSVKILSW